MTGSQLNVAVVDCSSSKVPDIVRLVRQFDAGVRVIKPSQLQVLATDPPGAVIISGNPALIGDTGTGFLTDFSILRTLDVPVLGICFGHQVIGLLYGAKVSTGKEDRQLRQVEVLRAGSLFSGVKNMENFQQDHCEEVSLPNDFLHLATSDHCFNEAMKHPRRPIWGVQFHPECSAGPGQRLIENFLSYCAHRLDVRNRAPG